MEVRRIRGDEGSQLREIRLRALADSPTAFAASYSDEKDLPEAHWEHKAQASATDPRSATFVAVEGDRWAGIIGGYFGPDAPKTAKVVAMWVDPSARGKGVARSLLGNLLEWAAEMGATAAECWFTKGNEGALKLYKSSGFILTGRSMPLPSDPSITAVLMVCRL